MWGSKLWREYIFDLISVSIPSTLIKTGGWGSMRVFHLTDKICVKNDNMNSCTVKMVCWNDCSYHYSFISNSLHWPWLFWEILTEEIATYISVMVNGHYINFFGKNKYHNWLLLARLLPNTQLFKSFEFGNGSRISDENLVILEFKYLQNKKW